MRASGIILACNETALSETFCHPQITIGFANFKKKYFYLFGCVGLVL